MDKDAKVAWLLESLKFVEQTYLSVYADRGCRSPLFHAFIAPSNHPLYPSGETSIFLKSLLSEGRRLNHEVVFVVSGWDGLTTNLLTFVHLFEECVRDPACKCRLRIFADEPRRFYDVNVVQAYGLFSGTIPLTDADSLDDSTGLFCDNFRKIYVAKERLSAGTHQVCLICDPSLGCSKANAS